MTEGLISGRLAGMDARCYPSNSAALRVEQALRHIGTPFLAKLQQIMSIVLPNDGQLIL
jgi:hypothetical protein